MHLSRQQGQRADTFLGTEHIRPRFRQALASLLLGQSVLGAAHSLANLIKVHGMPGNDCFLEGCFGVVHTLLSV